MELPERFSDGVDSIKSTMHYKHIELWNKFDSVDTTVRIMPGLIASHFYVFLISIFFFFALTSSWLGMAAQTMVLKSNENRKGVVDLIIEKKTYEKDGREVGVER